MATDLKSDHDQSVTTLVSGIISDAQALIEQQFKLLKHEVREDVRKTKDAILICTCGLGLSMVALILLAFMLAHMLYAAAPSLPLWSCYGICGVLILLLALGLIYAGITQFRTLNPLPEESAIALKENVQWITNPK